MTKREVNQQRSLEAFLARKAEFNALLAELQQASVDHFEADPETVLWGEAAWLADTTAKLKDIADQHFRRGEYTPPNAGRSRTAPTGSCPEGEGAAAPEPAQAAPTRTPRASLRNAAAAVLAAWDDEANRETDMITAVDTPMQALRAALAGKPARTSREPGAPRKPREGIKQEAVLAMLRREEGATIAQICEATSWQQHTARDFFTGLKKRQGITVVAAERIRPLGPNKAGAKGSFTIYRIAD